MTVTRFDGSDAPDRLGTGVSGFDDVLDGGLPAQRLYLIQGDPGAGKTTLALQFLLEGVRRGERVLYLTLSETPDELGDIARAHGWSLAGVSITEVSSDLAPDDALQRLEGDAGAKAVERCLPVRSIAQVHGVVIAVGKPEPEQEPPGRLGPDGVDEGLTQQAQRRRAQDHDTLFVQADDTEVGTEVQHLGELKARGFGRHRGRWPA